jgi:hypothetical protein
MRFFKAFLVLMLSMFPAMAFANSAVSSGEIPNELQEIMSQSGESSGKLEVKGDANASAPMDECTAWTECFDGTVINCWSRGMTCRSSFSSGRWVLCESWGYDRTYSRFAYSCY